MFVYEISSLDGLGHVCRTRAAVCQSDMAAFREARKDRGSHEIEIWQGPRLVARIKHDDGHMAGPHFSIGGPQS